MKTIIQEVRNAQSKNSSGDLFEVEINHPVHGWLPYTVGAGCKSVTIDNDSVIELIGAEFLAYVEPTQEELDTIEAEAVRSWRDHKLKTEVDPVVSNTLRWSDVTEADKANIASYRASLLDVTNQTGFPNNITWPVKPDVL